jgi:hypothetical protein
VVCRTHTPTEKSPKLPVATYVAAVSDFFSVFSGLFLFFFSEFLKALNDLRKYAEKPETQERIGTQFCLLYLYKKTNTDAEAGGRQAPCSVCGG